MIRRTLSIAALLAAFAVQAEAQSNLTANLTLVAGGAAYQQFTVTTAGTFDIWTTSLTYPVGSTPFDPVMYLFAGAGTGGSVISINDDGCSAFPQCGPSSAFSNSIFNNIVLGLGTYTIAVGGFSFDETAARTGVNAGNTYAGDFSVRIASTFEFVGDVQAGTASLNGQSVVPEPSSLALVTAGLMGLGAAARRRKQA